ncbi:MAG TPA: methyl-accepting chemotaxis protein [Fimbriimonadaceae bacterium]|nr:methyl-accepting chemotaxis protein [Fimbriimonadaceae bacterium]HRJ32472.1 methyl-accepting chemotaxis protein [Fimbriimonadaceae bacterium]
MNFLDRLSIRAKLLLISVSITVLLIVQGVLSVGGLGKMLESKNEVVQEHVRPIFNLQTLVDNIAVDIVDTTHKVAAGAMSWESGIQKVEGAQAKVKSAWGAIEGTPMDDVTAAKFAEARSLQEPVDTVTTQILAAMKNRDRKTLERIRTEALYPSVEPFNKAVAETMAAKAGMIESHEKKSQGTYSSAVVSTWVSVIASILIGVIVSQLIGSRMSRQAESLCARMTRLCEKDIFGIRRGLEALAEGNLTREVYPETEPVPIQGKDEFARVDEGFNRVINEICMSISAYSQSRQHLCGVIGDVHHTNRDVIAHAESLSDRTNDMSKASDELRNVVNQVSSAAEHSAFGAQQIAESNVALARTADQAVTKMDSMVELVEQVAQGSQTQTETLEKTEDRLQAARRSVQHTTDGIAQIDRQIQQMSESVLSLGEKGKQIGEIVKVIEEIAEQTNLLALNAAIEAARAGDAGRGFAVVADEVRKLAERAASSTREISSLIFSVRTDVESAVHATESTTQEVRNLNEAATAMSATVDQVSDALQSVKAVASANVEGVQEVVHHVQAVRTNMGQVSSTVDQNSSAAEGLSATAEENAAAAQEMNATVDHQHQTILQVEALFQQLISQVNAVQQKVAQFQTERPASDLDLRRAA